MAHWSARHALTKPRTTLPCQIRQCIEPVYSPTLVLSGWQPSPGDVTSRQDWDTSGQSCAEQLQLIPRIYIARNSSIRPSHEHYNIPLVNSNNVAREILAVKRYPTLQNTNEIETLMPKFQSLYLAPTYVSSIGLYQSATSSSPYFMSTENTSLPPQAKACLAIQIDSQSVGKSQLDKGQAWRVWDATSIIYNWWYLFYHGQTNGPIKKQQQRTTTNCNN